MLYPFGLYNIPIHSLSWRRGSSMFQPTEFGCIITITCQFIKPFDPHGDPSNLGWRFAKVDEKFLLYADSE